MVGAYSGFQLRGLRKLAFKYGVDVAVVGEDMAMCGDFGGVGVGVGGVGVGGVGIGGIG